MLDGALGIVGFPFPIHVARKGAFLENRKGHGSGSRRWRHESGFLKFQSWTSKPLLTIDEHGARRPENRANFLVSAIPYTFADFIFFFFLFFFFSFFFFYFFSDSPHYRMAASKRSSCSLLRYVFEVRSVTVTTHVRHRT